MKTIVLCEGTGDAAVIAFYLQNRCNWKIVSKSDKNNVKIRFYGTDKISLCKYENESFYTKGDDIISLCKVNGRDNFIKIYKNLSDLYNLDYDIDIDNLIIVTDNDDGDLTAVLQWISCELDSCGFNVGNLYNMTKNNYELFTVIPIVIPENDKGELESIIMERIASFGVDESLIVKESKDFIEMLKSNFHTNMYLKRRGDISKAKLTVTMSVINPTVMFSKYVEVLIKSEYYKSSVADKYFGIIDDCSTRKIKTMHLI